MNRPPAEETVNVRGISECMKETTFDSRSETTLAADVLRLGCQPLSWLCRAAGTRLLGTFAPRMIVRSSETPSLMGLLDSRGILEGRAVQLSVPKRKAVLGRLRLSLTAAEDEATIFGRLNKADTGVSEGGSFVLELCGENGAWSELQESKHFLHLSIHLIPSKLFFRLIYDSL